MRIAWHPPVMLNEIDCKCLNVVIESHGLKNVISEPMCHKSKIATLINVILTSDYRRIAGTLNTNVGLSNYHNFVAFRTNSILLRKRQKLLLRFTRTQVLISRSRLNNRATMEADILSFTGILTPEAASITSCFPFDITISLCWFPLLYLHYTQLCHRGRETSSWFSILCLRCTLLCYTRRGNFHTQLARLFCCRNLHRLELCRDSPKASTQGTVEQSRMVRTKLAKCAWLLSHMCMGESICGKGCCIGIHYTIGKFIVNI